jgi:hypothetical protein
VAGPPVTVVVGETVEEGWLIVPLAVETGVPDTAIDVILEVELAAAEFETVEEAVEEDEFAEGEIAEDDTTKDEAERDKVAEDETCSVDEEEFPTKLIVLVTLTITVEVVVLIPAEQARSVEVELIEPFDTPVEERLPVVLKAAPGSVEEVTLGASDADDSASLAIFTTFLPSFPWVSDENHPCKKN